jgi:ABC-2 type transport system ATP-binding protein
MSILVENVSKLYGTQKALENVSFRIDNGEIVGFIGPNGAGKSTMMKIICGFVAPSEGKINVNGFDVTEQALDVRRNIGYLPEQNPLYLDMYVKEFLTFSAGLFKLQNIPAKVKDMIEKTGLGREQHKKIGSLSKGYRQRVGLAHALIHDPAVLILDEPTTGLDPNQIIEIRNLISEVGKSKTVMLSTHLMQEVEAICHRVIIIRNGQIVANDKAETLTSSLTRQSYTVLLELAADASTDTLKSIPGVDIIKEVKPCHWLLSNNEGDDIRESIFKFAVNNGMTVLSMQKQEKSLEEVFQELTRQ